MNTNMNSIYRDIFRAVHEGKWLSIEYRNRNGQTTKYWIGIRDLNMKSRSLKVDGLHLMKYVTDSYDRIYIDSILSSSVIEGSYCPVNADLVKDINLNPHKYKTLFDHTVNLKILNYLEMCNRMDTVPYHSDFKLIRMLDRESFHDETYALNDEQFRSIVRNFQYKSEEPKKADGRLKIQQLAMNVLSIHTPEGLYVLAYKKLQLDVKNRLLRPDSEITVCTEYTINGTVKSIRKFLDADEYELLKNFEANQEKIKDCITRKNQKPCVDDMPYMIGLGMDIALDLHSEYKAIIDMYHNDKVTVPLRAFFGDLLSRPIRKKAYPIALVNHNINMDQLLAINNAMKYPVAYIQGPPGTGKTNTIINTIVTAFFNNKTVLFASYNNHPINGVFDKLSTMKYNGKIIPFPILRLGNNGKVKEALIYMKLLYEQVGNITVFERTLDRKKDDRTQRAKRLSALLKKYEELLDLRERSETLNRLLEYEKKGKQTMQMIPFQADLSGRQLEQVNREIEKAGNITDEEAMSLLDDNLDELNKYLFYTSAKYIQKLNEPKNKDLKDIIMMDNNEMQVSSFAKYLSDSGNLKKLQKIFPVIATTCISAHRLGEPEPLFDMTIIDEASQCNTAVSLVPVLRGESLMLVGDPQQLNPVIVLDELVNQKLKKRYGISEEYDYRKNSVYKTFLACDAVSDEILLHNHYRCNKQIIEFNNKKYYNSMLHILTKNNEKEPLLYIDVPENDAAEKNTAPAEAVEIIRYAAQNTDKSIGVITPFANQKILIEQMVKKENLANVTCGTVHAFQGDEKDVVLFSTAITNQTRAGTYEWLKNNKELLNVATSRAVSKLIILSSSQNLDRLHQNNADDDLFELVQYVKTNGQSTVTQKHANSRALGVKPFSTATENAFLQNLTHALENIWLSQSKYKIQKEVAISHVFRDNPDYNDLFYSGRFDFVVYEVLGQNEMPVLAIELDGKEHYEDEVVMQRDKKKNEICRTHDLQLIRVENSYARRYNHIKEILMNYFSVRH